MCELHPNYDTFANNEGERIAQVEALILHFLIAAECFDDSALAHLAKYSPHDVKTLQTTPFDPSRTSSMTTLAVTESDGLVAKVDAEIVDTLSDVDDDEIDSYIHNEDEVNLRRLVWSEMNREYLEVQASKEQAASLTSGPTKKKYKKSPAALPAETPAEAARQVLSKKKGSSKINYEALENLFKVSDSSQPPPNSKATSDVENDASPANDLRASRLARRGARPAGLPSSAPTKSTKRRSSSATTPTNARASGLAKRPSASVKKD
jgi:transcription factor IIIB subunit 2